MEKYIKSLAFSIGGSKKHYINPYFLTKYNYAVRETHFKHKKVRNWHKTEDEMFNETIKIDEAFDTKIAEDQE